MKKLILIAALLIPSIVSAQGLPAGCYVAYVDNPGGVWCYNGYATPDYSLSLNDRDYFYGYQIGDRMLEAEEYLNRAFVAEANLAAANNNLNTCVAGYNAQSETISNCSNYSSLQAAAISKNNKLIKKLRKACGTKCKKIK